MKKLFLFIPLLLLFLVRPINTKADEISLIPGAVSGILMEKSTGKILYEKESARRLPPASMTKIMTLLLIFEQIDQNNLTYDKVIKASENASSMGGSQVYLKAGEELSVDEALKCICIASANDCAVMLAEEISGSEEAFVQNMNKKALELGCKNTLFSDCTGLTSKNHYSSAYDMALISKELLTKHPDVLKYTNIKEDYIRKDTSSPFWLVNTNKMIGRVEGLNGLKTGFTSFSGYCITLSMTNGNMDLISVVFGYDKSTTRNQESLALLKYGFSNYKMDTIVKKGDVLDCKSHILYKNDIKITVNDDVKYLCRKSDKNNYDYILDYKIEKNELNGKLIVKINDTNLEEEIILTEELDKKNIFEVMRSIIGKII